MLVVERMERLTKRAGTHRSQALRLSKNLMSTNKQTKVPAIIGYYRTVFIEGWRGNVNGLQIDNY